MLPLLGGGGLSIQHGRERFITGVLSFEGRDNLSFTCLH